MAFAAVSAAVTWKSISWQNDNTVAEAPDSVFEAMETWGDTTPYAENNSSSVLQETETKKAAAIIRPTEQAEFTTKQIVKLYSNAANAVKKQKPGYTKREYQSLFDLKLNGASNKWLSYAQDFVTDKSEAEPITVKKGSAQSADYFPLYNRPEGCALTDCSEVQFARCVSGEDYYDIYILMKPALDPDYKLSPLALILTPINPEMIEKPLADKRVSRFVKDYEYRLKYYDCYVRARVGKDGRIFSLTQVMNCCVTANGVIKPLGKRASASGCVQNVAEFYNFKY